MQQAKANREIVCRVLGMALLGLVCGGGCGVQPAPSTVPPAPGPSRAAGKVVAEDGRGTPAPVPSADAAGQGAGSTAAGAVARDFPLPGAVPASTPADTGPDGVDRGNAVERDGPRVAGNGAGTAPTPEAPGDASPPPPPSASHASPDPDATTTTPAPVDGASAWEDPAQTSPDREPLFVDWPQPRLVLVFTGLQSGFFEPCGCSGLENQKGGLSRRFTLLEQLARRNWRVVPIDAGNQVRRFGRQSEIKFQMTIEGLRKMEYRAVGFGPDDLRLPAPELVAVVAPTGTEPSRFVSANVTILDPSFTAPYRILEEAGQRIGITMVLGQREQSQVSSAEVTMRDAAAALREVWPALERAACDLHVLVAHASIEESQRLARQFPQFTLVVTTGGAGEPTREPVVIEGTSSQMIEVGTKGMFASVVGVFDDPAHPLRYQRVPLDARFPDAAEGLQLLAAYQDQLREVGFEGLGIRPQPHPSGREYIGSAACADCHDHAWRVWQDGVDGHAPKHSHAYATLQNPPNRAAIPRNFDPECLSCHVVGWNPQQHVPYRSGYVSLDETPDLIHVGCEDCHGPGKQHADAENGVVELERDEMKRLRREMALKLEKAEQRCLECHDLDNSPGFQEEGAFEKYWAKVKH